MCATRRAWLSPSLHTPAHVCREQRTDLVPQGLFVPVLPRRVRIQGHLCSLKKQTSAFTIRCPNPLDLGGDWRFLGSTGVFENDCPLMCGRGMLKLRDVGNGSPAQTLPRADRTVCLWKQPSSQIHGLVWVLRRSLPQPPAQSTICSEVRRGFSGLFPTRSQKPLITSPDHLFQHLSARIKPDGEYSFVCGAFGCVKINLIKKKSLKNVLTFL